FPRQASCITANCLWHRAFLAAIEETGASRYFPPARYRYFWLSRHIGFVLLRATRYPEMQGPQRGSQAFGTAVGPHWAAVQRETICQARRRYRRRGGCMDNILYGSSCLGLCSGDRLLRDSSPSRFAMNETPNQSMKPNGHRFCLTYSFLPKFL